MRTVGIVRTEGEADTWTDWVSYGIVAYSVASVWSIIPSEQSAVCIVMRIGVCEGGARTPETTTCKSFVL